MTVSKGEDTVIKKDYCSGFFESWFAWDRKYIIKRIDLAQLICKPHDEHCSSTSIFKGVWEHKVMFGLLIASVASIACWVKYPKHMKDRV